MKISTIIIALTLTSMINSQMSGGYIKQSVKDYPKNPANNLILQQALAASEKSAGPSFQFFQVEQVQDQVVFGVQSGTNTKFTLLYQSLSDKTQGKEFEVVVFTQAQTNKLQVVSLNFKAVPIVLTASSKSGSLRSASSSSKSSPSNSVNSASSSLASSSSASVVTYLNQNVQTYLANPDNAASYQLALKVSSESIGSGFSLPQVQSIATQGANTKFTFLFQNTAIPNQALQFVVVIKQAADKKLKVTLKEKSSVSA